MIDKFKTIDSLTILRRTKRYKKGYQGQQTYKMHHTGEKTRQEIQKRTNIYILVHY